jgi:hypothetical protein
MTKPDELRRILEAEFGVPLNDVAWRILGAFGFLSYLNPARGEDRAELLDRYQTLITSIEGAGTRTGAARAKSKKPSPSGKPESDVRLAILQAVLLIRANADPNVLAFREKHLGGKTLESEEVGPWLDEIARREEPLPGDPSVAIWAPPDKEGEWLNRRIIAHDHGVIAELKRAIETSSGPEPAGWEFLGAETAVMRVLTGRLQELQKCLVTIKRSHSTPALTTVVLQVNYHMTPREVARLYQEARTGVGRSGRDRSLEPKSFFLALFTQMHKPGHTWAQVQEKWNHEWRHDKQYPDWVYSTDPTTTKPKQFARDCRNAFRNLTGAKWSDGESAEVLDDDESEDGVR